MAVDVRQSVIDASFHRPFGAGQRHLRQFLDVVDEVYRDDPNYVRPLDFDLRQRLSTKNPFFQHAEGIVLTARRGGRVLGRATAQVDREHLARYRDDVGFFGFFDTVDDQEVASALLENAGRWLRDKGMKTMRGPFSLSINEELGCLVEGFDTPPMLLMTHHRDYQGGLIEGAGLAKAKDFYAWRYSVGDVPARARRASDEVAALPEVSARMLDPKQLERDVRLVMDIFNDAWSDNWGFVPLTEAELRKMAEDFRLLLVPELTLLVSVDGEPVAFAIALPNLNAMIRDLHGKLLPTGAAKLLFRLKVSGPDEARLVLLGVRRKLRHVRKYAALSTYMYTKMNEAGQRLGIRRGELSWTLEDNGAVNAGIRFMGGKLYKRYRVYEKALLARARSMNVLVTGASGFLGSHIAEKLAGAGHHVRALVRPTSDVDFLQTLPGLEFVTGSVDDPASLPDAVAGVDGVVHAAGLLKARSADEFFRCNAAGTENLLAAVHKHAPAIERFVLVSSLAAAAPSVDGVPIAGDVEPRPLTDYGRSKLAAERAARSYAGRLPITILRPPMVYGPRDRKTLQLFVAADRRVLPALGDPEGKLSVLFGPDCARACVLALRAEVPSGSAYFLSDGRVYTRRELLAGLERAVGKRALVSLPLPPLVVRAAALASEAYGRLSKRAVMFDRQRLAELLGQWVCDPSDAARALGFRAEVDWFEGTRRSARWYRDNGWLP